MFKNQAEYEEFKAWAVEGSCLRQRMQSAEGGVFTIPDYWEKFKPIARTLPDILPAYLED